MTSEETKAAEDVYFQEKLRLGIAAEDMMLVWLRATYGFVEDKRKQKYEEGEGPRIKGQSGSVTVPDFFVIDQHRGNMFVEVKWKEQPTKRNGKEYFTIDYKLEHYKRCVQLYRADKLVIVFVCNDEKYFYDGNDHLPDIVHYNNKFGKYAYMYEVDRTKIKK